MAENKDPTQTVLNNVVLMYPNLPPDPMSARPGSTKLSHSTEIVLVEGSDAYTAALAGQQAALEKMWPDPKKRPGNIRLAVKDPMAPSETRAGGGPARQGEAYEDADGQGKRWYLRAATTFDFPVWVGKNKATPKVGDFYSGAVALVVVKFAAYSSPGTGSGVTAYLQHVWKLRDGKQYGSAGGTAALLDNLEGLDVQFSDEGADVFEGLGV